jgi:preprotein translocase subunit SecB
MAAENNSSNENGQAAGGQKSFAIRRLYTRDVSFESPNAPQIFNEEKWTPDVSMNLQNQARLLGGDFYEVTVTITVTVKLGERVAYLVEVQQAGEFQATGFQGEELRQLLGIYCPGVLYPFLRETVASLVAKGGFPPLLLAPVNFDALYMQHQQSQRAAAQQSADA